MDPINQKWSWIILQEYFFGKSECVLKEIKDDTKIQENILCCNERIDAEGNFENLEIKHSTFANIGLYKSKFIRCKFQQCVFIECYFRYAELQYIDFTGCKFIKCNFGSTKIENSTFMYASFEQCYIKYDILKFNFPLIENNLTWKLCLNMERECLNIGDASDADKYFWAAKNAADRNLKDIILLRNTYERDRYNIINQCKAFYRLVLSKLNRFVWGYGESIYKLIRSSFLVIILYAVFYYKSSALQPSHVSNLYESILFSLQIFFNLSPTYDVATVLKTAIISEGVFGVIFLGLTITAFFRFINRR